MKPEQHAWLGGDLRKSWVREAILPHIRTVIVTENKKLGEWEFRMKDNYMEAGTKAWENLTGFLSNLRKRN
jgi:hypothetical protein